MGKINKYIIIQYILGDCSGIDTFIIFVLIMINYLLASIPWLKHHY